MVRHHHVVSYDINSDYNAKETQVWWRTLPGVMSYVHKIEYHTGDTVYFNIDGSVDCVFGSDGYTDAV